MDKRYNNSYLKNLYLDELSKTIGAYEKLTDQLNDIIGSGKDSMTNVINRINVSIATQLDESLIEEIKANRAETPFEVDLKNPKPIVKAFAKMNRANQSWLLDQEGDNYKFMALKNLSEQTRYLRSFLIEAGKALSYDDTRPIADLVTFLSSTDEVLSKLSEQVDKNNNTMNVDVDFWKNYSNFLSGEINALKNSIVRGEMARAVAERVEKDEAAPIFVNTNTAKTEPFVASNTVKVNNTKAGSASNNANDAQVSGATVENAAVNADVSTGDTSKKAKKGKVKKQLKAIVAGVLCAGYVVGAAFLGKAWGKATAKAEIDKKDAQIGQLEDKLDKVYDENGKVRDFVVLEILVYYPYPGGKFVSVAGGIFVIYGRVELHHFEVVHSFVVRIKRHIAPEIVLIRALNEFPFAVGFRIPTCKDPAAAFSRSDVVFRVEIRGYDVGVTKFGRVKHFGRSRVLNVRYLFLNIRVAHTIIHVHRVKRKVELRTNGNAYRVFHAFRPLHFRGFRTVHIHNVVNNVVDYAAERVFFHGKLYSRIRRVRTRGKSRAVVLNVVYLDRTYGKFVGIVVRNNYVVFFEIV